MVTHDPPALGEQKLLERSENCTKQRQRKKVRIPGQCTMDNANKNSDLHYSCVWCARVDEQKSFDRPAIRSQADDSK